MAKLGYVFVWRQEDDSDFRIGILQSEGCSQIFTEKVSGVRFIQIEFEKLLNLAKEGDTIVVCKLFYLGKDLGQLIKLIEQLNARRIYLKSLKESFDTATPTGELFCRVMCTLADTMKSIRSENTLEGLQRARAKGKKSGRSPKELDELYQIIASQVKKLHDSMQYSNATIQEIFAIKSRAAYYKILAFANKR